jgi:hypothetical protein
MQNRIKLRLFENYIIPAFPNSSANGSDTNPNQGLIVFTLIIKPRTEHMVIDLGWVKLVTYITYIYILINSQASMYIIIFS